MSIEIDTQYDKIYRYCFFRVHHREIAEDITQETFLRYLEHYSCVSSVSALKCLYTIARNLCVDGYRQMQTQPLEEALQDTVTEEQWITNLTVRAALSTLAPDEQELLLLRYVNEVPVTVIAKVFGISRFSVYRKLTSAANKFRRELEGGSV